MAISTYDELVTLITNWTHKRQDAQTLIPDFILLAEKSMFSNSDETLDVKDIEKTSTATLNGTSPNQTRFLAFPQGMLNNRSIVLIDNNNRINLSYVTPELMNVKSGVGRPNQYTITNQIEFNIVADKDYTVELKYLAEPLGLTSTNQTNDVLTNNPDIYLYGVMSQFAMWTDEQEELVKWYAKFIDAIKGANRKTKRSRYGVSPRMRVSGVTP